jgi:hypothetical protein
MSIPKVFISYSHDSLEHKKWVNQFATRMRNHGIDSILDQWELTAGDDLPHFMETHLASADFIVMICTDRYVKKANEGKGGVGYEKMIITSNLLENIDNNKIIPIIRQSDTSDIPTFLKTKLYINFSKNSDFEFSYDELIRNIHDSPVLKKPEIGNNPFKEPSELVESKSKDGIQELIKLIVGFFENSQEQKYILYASIVRDSNISRIYVDILLDEALKDGYITRDSDGDILLTTRGKQYAIENNLTR